MLMSKILRYPVMTVCSICVDLSSHIAAAKTAWWYNSLSPFDWQIWILEWSLCILKIGPVQS